MMFLVEYVEDLLRRNPHFGIASSVIAVIMPNLEVMSEIVRLLGALLGIAIGLLTFLIQLKVLAEKYPNSRILRFLGFKPKDDDKKDKEKDK
jgi:hypothetical protein